MKRRLAGLIAVAVLALFSLSAAAPLAKAGTLVLPRSGQVGLGMSGQVGTLLSSGDYGKEFGTGGGIKVNLRYRMRFERAMGLTFDMQRLAAREPSGAAGAFDSLTDAPAVLRKQLRFNTAGVEFYQLFDTREPVTKLLSAGFGLVQTSARLTNGETQFPIAGDGFYLSAGAGIEKFVWRSWAWDSGLRYMAIFHDGTVNHDVQLHTGFIFYAAY
jgi:Outer membrane protein beta-barrel domain